MDTAEQRLAEAIGRELSRRYNHPMIGHSCVCNDTGLCGLHASQGRIAVEVVKGQENPGFWLPDVLVEARQERDQARADAEQVKTEWGEENMRRLKAEADLDTLLAEVERLTDQQRAAELGWKGAVELLDPVRDERDAALARVEASEAALSVVERTPDALELTAAKVRAEKRVEELEATLALAKALDRHVQTCDDHAGYYGCRAANAIAKQFRAALQSGESIPSNPSFLVDTSDWPTPAERDAAINKWRDSLESGESVRGEER